MVSALLDVIRNVRTFLGAHVGQLSPDETYACADGCCDLFYRLRLRGTAVEDALLFDVFYCVHRGQSISTASIYPVTLVTKITASGVMIFRTVQAPSLVQIARLRA